MFHLEILKKNLKLELKGGDLVPVASVASFGPNIPEEDLKQGCSHFF